MPYTYTDPTIGLLLLGSVVYFLPALIASRRKHANAMPIFLLNLLLGWSVLGWIGALIWCATAQPIQRS